MIISNSKDIDPGDLWDAIIDFPGVIVTENKIDPITEAPTTYRASTITMYRGTDGDWAIDGTHDRAPNLVDLMVVLGDVVKKKKPKKPK